MSSEDEQRADIERQWREFALKVDLEIVYSRYRELVGPVIEYLDELDQRWRNDTVTVVIPEFVVGRWYEHLLHNQSALLLKGRLLYRDATVVTSVPYHVHTGDGHTGDSGLDVSPGQKLGSEPTKPCSPRSPDPNARP